MSVLAPLVVILGPTASGKSSLAIRLAQQLDGEVLVCDSTQVYRHFDIGTAKVPLAERHGIAHRLIDLVEPDEIFTAGEYRRQALLALTEVSQRGKLPILTAGTGLYLRALLEGLADAPERSEELRARLRAKAQLRGADYLHRTLARLDPENCAANWPSRYPESDSRHRDEDTGRKAGGRNSSRRTQQSGRLSRAKNWTLASTRCPLRKNRRAHRRHAQWRLARRSA
jgi:tRNA A37 N6-isopentenylltransferase MiaA